MTTHELIFLATIAAIVILAIAWACAPRINRLIRFWVPGVRGIAAFGPPSEKASRDADEH
jgi:hypothetical protein